MKFHLIFKQTILLFLIIQCNLLINFIVSFSSTEISIGAYFKLISFIFILYYSRVNKKKFLFLIFLFVYFLLYSINYEGLLNHKARENVNLILTIACFITFSNVDYDLKDWSKYKSFFGYFSIYFVLIYFISVFTTGSLFEMNIEVKSIYRTYYRGYILPHAFGYYVVLLGYFIMKTRSFTSSLPLYFSSFTTGARSSFVIFLYTVTYDALITTKLTFIKLIRTVTIIISFLLLLNFSLKLIKPLDYVVKSTIQMISMGSNLFSANEGIELSFGRTFFWKLGIEEILYESTQNEFLFGKGPLAAEKFFANRSYGIAWFHNDFLQIFYTHGLLGFLLYIFSVLYYTIKQKDYYFLGFMFFAAFSNGFYSYDPLQFIIISSLINFYIRVEKYNRSII